jgi:activator of 2-hydroxyglutaryl-CoA dehydratase
MMNSTQKIHAISLKIYLTMMMMIDSGSEKFKLLVMKIQECVSLVMVLYVVYWMITKQKPKIVQIVLMLIGITSIRNNVSQLKVSGSNKTTTSKAMNVKKLVTQIILQMMKLLPNA